MLSVWHRSRLGKELRSPQDLDRRTVATTSGLFGIDVLGFAILSNHFHLILRSRPDCVETWDDTEVARRWLMLCPVRKDQQCHAEEPSNVELNSIRNDKDRVTTIRSRLSDLSWWMRLLCQQIAVRANKEDKEDGRFFQSRYRAVRLLDEQALVACAAYVDLNPIRAALSETLEASDSSAIETRSAFLVRVGRQVWKPMFNARRAGDVSPLILLILRIAHNY